MPKNGTQKPDTLSCFDLFAGCGGLSLGLEQAGCRVLWANEFDNHAAETYRRAHRAVEVFEEDASVLYTQMIDQREGLPSPGEVDLLAGGPHVRASVGTTATVRRKIHETRLSRHSWIS